MHRYFCYQQNNIFMGSKYMGIFLRHPKTSDPATDPVMKRMSQMSSLIQMQYASILLLPTKQYFYGKQIYGNISPTP